MLCWVLAGQAGLTLTPAGEGLTVVDSWPPPGGMGGAGRQLISAAILMCGDSDPWGPPVCTSGSETAAGVLPSLASAP